MAGELFQMWCFSAYCNLWKCYEPFSSSGDENGYEPMGPRPHFVGEIWKWRFTLNMHQMFSVHTKPEKFENGGLLWIRIKCFPSTLSRRNLKTQQSLVYWICVWGKLGQVNHMVIVTPSFSKSSVFKMVSVHTKAQSRRFIIPPVWRAFSKSSVIVME